MEDIKDWKKLTINILKSLGVGSVVLLGIILVLGLAVRLFPWSIFGMFAGLIGWGICEKMGWIDND